jgi:YHS domain-containing protein
MDCEKCLVKFSKRSPSTVYFPFTKHIVFCSLSCWNKYLKNACCHCGNTVNNKTSYNCMRLSGTTFRFCNELCYKSFLSVNEDRIFDAMERGETDLKKYQFAINIMDDSQPIHHDTDSDDVDIGAKSGIIFKSVNYHKIFA